jgi:pyruvate/2-oxoglutarate dehydrogenase complex dihydrolipoamide acyltransferase (E2) component
MVGDKARKAHSERLEQIKGIREEIGKQTTKSWNSAQGYLQIMEAYQIAVTLERQAIIDSETQS